MGKIRCTNCDSVISDGQTQCLSCGSKDFYDEDEKKREEEKKERISKWKNMPKGKKTAILLAIVGVFVFSIIMGILFPAEETGVDKIETSCYLTETCSTDLGEVTITSVEYLDYYLTESGKKYVSGSKNIICLYGGVINNSDKSMSFLKGSFILELKDGTKLKPVSCAFTDNSNVVFDKIVLNSNLGILLFAFYEVNDSIKIEDCRLIYYDNAIALKNR